MNPLFSKKSLMILESLSFTKTLYAFDFDGTLSKIVGNPSDATLTKSTESLLKELSALVPIAIVSGRSIPDLKQRLSFSPKFLIGNHGMEGLDNNGSTLKNAEAICAGWKKAFTQLNLPLGIEVEDKSFSFALHYRHSRNKNLARQKIKEIVDSLSPAPQVITGKSVVNLLPPGAPHKGIAVLELMKREMAKQVFYIGDDDTDEDVFGLPNSRIMSVRVGQKKASQAQFYIRRQSEINQLLKLLIQFHLPLEKSRKSFSKK